MKPTSPNGAKLRSADKLEKAGKSVAGYKSANGRAKDERAELKEDRAPLEDAVRVILRHIGEDPNREGLRSTPTRVAKAYEFLTSGYSKDPKDAINGALFTEED